MKFSLCTIILTIFTAAMAIPAEQNFNKQIADLNNTMDEAYKKIKELLGYQADFDKKKFLDLLNDTCNKMAGDFKTLTEKLQLESKSVPADLQNKYNELLQEFNSAIKNFNSVDTKKKIEEIQSTVFGTMKNLGTQVNDITKSFGVSMPSDVQNTLGDVVSEMLKVAKNLEHRGEEFMEGIKEKKHEHEHEHDGHDHHHH